MINHLYNHVKCVYIHFAKKYFKHVIYEKHGQAKYIQKLSISILKKSKNLVLMRFFKNSSYNLKNFE